MEYFIAVHPGDAEWMVGEKIAYAKHAVRTQGYDLKGIHEFAAGQNLKVLKVSKSGVIVPVVISY